MGEGRACNQLAFSYWGSKEDNERIKAGPLWLRSCNSGDASGCYDLGQRLNGPDRDHFGKAFVSAQPAGMVFMGKACKAGLDYACISTADAYVAGTAGGKDGLAALDLLTVSCDRGSPRACVKAGRLFETGVLTKDDAKAVGFYKKTCEMTDVGGNPKFGALAGCVALAHMQERGAGMPKDETAAAATYRKACDPSEKVPSADGCIDLARMYDTGKGGTKDGAKGAEALIFGCSKYNPASCFALGGRFEKGIGLPKNEKKDDKKAAEFYQKACNSQSTEGCLAAATMASQGRGGLSKADKDVAGYYRRGCNASYVHADAAGDAAAAQSCAHIASMEASGKGVDKNATSAFRHYTTACDLGDKASCPQAKKLAPAP